MADQQDGWQPVLEPMPRRSSTGRLVAGGAIGCLGIAGFVAVALVLTLILAVRSCDVEVGPLGNNPGQGTDSMQLPIEVTPRTDLEDGQVVQVSSDAFPAHKIVGVTQCLPTAETESLGVAACDTDGGSRYAVGPDGMLVVDHPVRRVITVAGTAHDCAAVEAGCLLVVADVGDYNRSGGERIGFAEGPAVDLTPTIGRPPSLRLAVTATSETRYRAGEEVTLRAEGFVPGEPILLAWCTGAFETTGIDACEPESLDEAVGSMVGSSVDGVTRTADDEGVVEATLIARATVDPFLGQPAECTAAQPCWFAISAAADTQRSALLAYSVTG